MVSRFIFRIEIQCKIVLKEPTSEKSSADLTNTFTFPKIYLFKYFNLSVFNLAYTAFIDTYHTVKGNCITSKKHHFP